jgi:3-phenylpropionate/cinnamic acid dioxygenase small subunit
MSSAAPRSSLDRLEELVAREAIRDLVARYNAGADGGRFGQVVDLFAPDAVMELPDETLNGRYEIAALFRRVQQQVVGSETPSRPQFVRHFTSTLQIDIETGDRARSRCYYQVLTAHGLDHWGRYVDRYRRVEGEWRFAHRKVTVDGRTDRSLL